MIKIFVFLNIYKSISSYNMYHIFTNIFKINIKLFHNLITRVKLFLIYTCIYICMYNQITLNYVTFLKSTIIALYTNSTIIVCTIINIQIV